MGKIRSDDRKGEGKRIKEKREGKGKEENKRGKKKRGEERNEDHRTEQNRSGRYSDLGLISSADFQCL